MKPSAIPIRGLRRSSIRGRRRRDVQESRYTSDAEQFRAVKLVLQSTEGSHLRTRASRSEGRRALAMVLGGLLAGCAGSHEPAQHSKSMQVDLPHAVRLELVWIPGGTFWMGCSPSDSECAKDTKPSHQVRVDGFWMSRYELTQEQWEAVMGPTAGGQRAKEMPAEVGRWERAQEFLQRAGNGLRFPTEAEWEYAARAGCQARHYGELDAIAWYGNNSADEHIDAATLLRELRSPLKFADAMFAKGSRSHPVGRKKPNDFGLYDTLGNMFEWCQDTYSRGLYASREGIITDNPVVRVPDDSLHVIRSGAFLDPDFIVTVSARAFSTLTPRLPDAVLGLRVARSEPAVQ